MRKVIVSTFLTLDGVMQAPGGADQDPRDGFEHGGWQVPYLDEVTEAAVLDGMAESEGFLLGRRTYEIFAGFWPSVPEGDRFGDGMNGLTKFVASNSLDKVEWRNSTLIDGDVAEEVAKLKQQPGKDLQVIGSGELAQTLMQHGLVDEYRLLIHPIVLGSGRRLFPDGGPTTALELVDTKTTGTGVVIVTYRATGDAADGEER